MNQNVCIHALPLQPETMGKSIDSAGAGASWQSPGWLTQLNLLWGGKGVSGSGFLPLSGADISLMIIDHNLLWVSAAVWG